MTQLELPLAGPPPSPPVPCEYLTIAEAAERVRCCERTIRRAIESGAVRAGRIRGERGNRGGYRILLADLKHGCSTMPRSPRQPTIECRSHRRTDGTTTDSWCVRYYDVRGVRRRRSFASAEEAEFERGRLALEAVGQVDDRDALLADQERGEQLGHAPTMTLDTYSHVMREYRGAPPIDAEEWIRRTRDAAVG